MDTFEAVKVMCERYLWPYALCIIQNAGHKETQLQEMHRGYSDALLTTVTGRGVDANAGLPNIRPSSRSQTRLFEEARPDVRVAVSLPLPDAVDGSWPSSGAWTYEEQLLSRCFSSLDQRISDLVVFPRDKWWGCLGR